ncbi:MAG: BMP family ABC transporter substrate-binding protein [Thiomonas sp.]
MFTTRLKKPLGVLATAASLAVASLMGPAGAPAQAAEPLKIGFVYVGPVGDAGWSFAHNQARLALQAKFGDRIKTQFVESVPEGPDSARVFRDLAQQGDGLIFATSFGYMESVLRVAKDFPKVKFEHATGYKTASNVGTYDARTYEGAYLAGVIAGGMTKSNVLGVVGSVPIPEVIRNIDSFTLGAQSVNPKITTKVVWVNKWFDPPKETEAATSLINQGADVLFQNTDSPAVLQTAEKMGKYGFGWDSNMSKFGGKAHLASATINWAPLYEMLTDEVLKGSWKPAQYWWGMKHDTIALQDISPLVPAALKKTVLEREAGLKSGSLTIWKGPIVDQSGKVVLPAGKVADDKFLHGITFYVKGVEGKVPGQ